MRNFHQAFHGGLWKGMAHAALQYITGGRGLVDPMPLRRRMRATPGGWQWEAGR